MAPVTGAIDMSVEDFRFEVKELCTTPNCSLTVEWDASGTECVCEKKHVGDSCFLTFAGSIVLIDREQANIRFRVPLNHKQWVELLSTNPEGLQTPSGADAAAEQARTAVVCGIVQCEAGQVQSVYYGFRSDTAVVDLSGKAQLDNYHVLRQQSDL
jgi:hypothetical protein